MESQNLETASIYINNLLLSRGLLRNGVAIKFADPVNGEGGLEGTEPMFEIPLEGDERRQAIEAALRQLPAEQRDVLTLKIWGELTFEQIGAQLEISPNTAASRYRYALTALREMLTAADCHG